MYCQTGRALAVANGTSAKSRWRATPMHECRCTIATRATPTDAVSGALPKRVGLIDQERISVLGNHRIEDAAGRILVWDHARAQLTNKELS